MNNESEQGAEILAFPGSEKIDANGVEASNKTQEFIAKVPEGLEPTTRPNLSVVPDVIAAEDVPIQPDTSVSVPEPTRIITTEQIPTAGDSNQAV